MKFQTLSIGGVGIYDPVQLQRYLTTEGWASPESQLIIDNLDEIERICTSRRIKNCSEFLLTGRAGNFRQFRNEPMKFEAVRVIKVHTGDKYQIDWVYVHEAKRDDLILLRRKTVMIPQTFTQLVS